MEIIKSIILLLYKPIRVVVGCTHTILSYEKTYVWGGNEYGQLGLGDKIRRYSPVKLPLQRIKSISCGSFHTVAVTSDNELYVWGDNAHGQLGLGDTNIRDTPQKLILSSSKIEHVVCGGQHTIILTTMNKIYVWGHNDCGQLGFGDMKDRYIPQELMLDNVISISCGTYHTIALTYHGTLYVWGYNRQGQLGLGDHDDRYIPQKLNLPFLDIKSVSCGAYHTVFLTSDDTLYSCGGNGEGKLGLGDTTCQNIPQKINLDNVKSVNCGREYTIAITKSNLLYSWGSNMFKQLGLEHRGYAMLPSVIKFYPTEPTLNEFDTVVCGSYHTIAVTNTDDIYVWGTNRCGQLGLGDDNNRISPCKLKFDF